MNRRGRRRRGTAKDNNYISSWNDLVQRLHANIDKENGITLLSGELSALENETEREFLEEQKQCTFLSSSLFYFHLVIESMLKEDQRLNDDNFYMDSLMTVFLLLQSSFHGVDIKLCV